MPLICVPRLYIGKIGGIVSRVRKNSDREPMGLPRSEAGRVGKCELVNSGLTHSLIDLTLALLNSR